MTGQVTTTCDNRLLLLRALPLPLPLPSGAGYARSGGYVEALAGIINAAVVPPSQRVQPAETIYGGPRGASAKNKMTMTLCFSVVVFFIKSFFVSARFGNGGGGSSSGGGGCLNVSVFLFNIYSFFLLLVFTFSSFSFTLDFALTTADGGGGGGGGTAAVEISALFGVF